MFSVLLLSNLNAQLMFYYSKARHYNMLNYILRCHEMFMYHNVMYEYSRAYSMCDFWENHFYLHKI